MQRSPLPFASNPRPTLRAKCPILGSIGTVAGLAGTLGAPKLASWLDGTGGGKGILRVGILMAAVAIPGVFLTGLGSSLSIVMLGLALTLVAVPIFPLLPPLIVQHASPPQLRAQLVALGLLASSILGLGVGPTLVGILSDTLFKGPEGVAQSLVLLAAIALPATICLLILALRTYPRLLAEAELEPEQ